ncbi:MAG: DUF4340 domain-containing protein, partial [Pirellulaceae bacterium]
MNETIKTLIYVAGAVLVIVGAIVAYPKQEEFKPPDLVGKPLFPDFTDPASAAELHIVRFREDMGRISEFEVTRDLETGLWVIPSSGNYPADAESQVRDAATSLIDLEVLGEVSKTASDHESWGVVEPTQQMDAAQSGVGLLVRVKDAKGDDLAKIIIGKRRKGAANQRFVRKPGIDTTYVVTIDPNKFPTDFQEWIERDLLKINPFDIKDITFKDYSTIKEQTSNGPPDTITRRFKAGITRDLDQDKWILNELVQYQNNEPRPTELLASEELNAPKLDDLVSALDALKIVGVMRKPAGLGADLKAGTEFTNSQENLLSLNSRGFHLIRFEEDQTELHAANGELLVSLANGVQYVLRFGKIADVAEESAEGRISRYLLVTARIDESRFPPLDLKPLPGGEESNDSAAEKADLELERERVRKENQRMKDERQERLNEARRIVSQLNARFADWYYIIAEEQYKRIHLRRNELIRESETAKEEEFGIDAFRRLQKQGLQDPQAEGPPKKVPKSVV